MIEAAGPTFPPATENNNMANLGGLSSLLLPEMSNGVINHSWDREWQDLWQNSGLDQSWIFSNIE